MKALVTFLFLIFSFNIAICQNQNANVVSEIRVETRDNLSILKARASNKTDLYRNLKYVFSITRFDKDYTPLNESLAQFLLSKDASKKTLEDFLNEQDDNKYTSRESVDDFFTLDPYQSKTLFEASVSTGLDENVIALLLIYDEDENLVDKNRVVFDKKRREKEMQKEQEVTEEAIRDEMEISGIVVDQTKTRMGRQFYDKFYYYYSYNEVKGDQVVKIDEIFSFQRTTRVMVIIMDKIIMEFFARPNEEYLEQMAFYAFNRVNEYFINRKKQKSYISDY